MKRPLRHRNLDRPAGRDARRRRAAPGGPLAGLRVVDLTRAMAGPYCTMLLGDLGTEVIKVEEPEKGDETRAWGPPFVRGESTYFLSANRNKKSIAIDLKRPEGRRLVSRLIARADILVENFRPGTLARLGFEPRRLLRRHRRLILCSISGYGQDGPHRDLPGYDLILQGEGGIMSLTGEVEGPPCKVGVAVADIGAGMFAAIGILAALEARRRSGRGQWVDTSLLEGQVSWMTYMASAYFATGANPARPGTGHPSIVPYQAFATRDIPITLAVNNEKLWRGFCDALGLGHLRDDARFSGNPQRVRNRHLLVPELEAHFRARSGREMLEKLRAAGIPCGPIQTIEDVCRDAQVLHRGMVEEMDHPVAGRVRQLGLPLKLSATPGALRLPPPTLGQHTDDILSGILGLAAPAIARLRKAGVVR
jgi:formyl-CoA transferase/CoA:oxalate CoA-transferase